MKLLSFALSAMGSGLQVGDVGGDLTNYNVRLLRIGMMNPLYTMNKYMPTKMKK
jgi:hypothetical protein